MNVVYGLHNLEFFQEISLKIEIQKHVKTSFNIVVCVLKDRKLRKGKILSLFSLYFRNLVVFWSANCNIVNKGDISRDCKSLHLFFFPKCKLWHFLFKSSFESCTPFFCSCFLVIWRGFRLLELEASIQQSTLACSKFL